VKAFLYRQAGAWRRNLQCTTKLQLGDEGSNKNGQGIRHLRRQTGAWLYNRYNVPPSSRLAAQAAIKIHYFF
jgi:hypothetical protein